MESLIKIALCATMSLLYEEALDILKKALGYAWHFENSTYEIKVYDEMGKV